MGTETFHAKKDNFRVVGLLCLFVSVGLMFGYINSHNDWFEWTFNAYGLLSSLAAVILAVVLVAVLKKGVKNEARTWYILYLVAGIVSSVAEACQRFSAHPEAAVFFASTISLGMNVASIALYLFAIAYTQTTALRNGLRVPIAFITYALVVFFYGHNGLIYQNGADQMVYSPWGYNNQPGPLFWIDLIWIMFPFIAASVILVKYRMRSKNALVRKQILFYIVASTLPIVLGMITDGLLPALRVRTPMMAMLISALSAVIIYIGTYRYKFFQIDPTILSDNILDTMKEAVVVTNQDFGVEFTNREARELFNLDEKTRVLSDLFPENTWLQVQAHLIEGKPLSQEFGHLMVKRQDGKEVPVQIASSPLQASMGYSAFVLVLSDITTLATSYNDLQASAERIKGLLAESQQLQKQLADEKANVEHTVEVRTQELRDAQAKLQTNEQMKNEFIALSSHNLRTPLSIIKGSLQMLDDGSLPPDKQSMMKSMGAGVQRLDDFIRDLLEIVSLESSSTVEAKPERLDTIVQPVVAEFQMYAVGKQITLNTQLHADDAMISANASLIQNCVRNLLNNALKFTKEQGRIEVVTGVEGERVKISVQDTGVGIKPEEIPLLFTKFHRGTSYQQYDYEGVGVALYITKLIVERHGGSIEVTSELDKGSDFTIYLPIYKNVL